MSMVHNSIATAVNTHKNEDYLTCN